MNKGSLLLLVLFYSLVSHAQEQPIESILSELPDVTYNKIKDYKDYKLYELHVKQPIDHEDTTNGFFTQKVYLSHKSFDRPTVIVTAGYDVNRIGHSELTPLLEANQIKVEHRYFGESVPDSLDYRFLNLKQATSDLHRIRQLFSTVYTNKWVSTGVSKGGATSIFYKYFYPDDVDASVPYVAPINNSYEDQRIYNFLDTIGSESCRNKIKAFQIKLLENREQLMPLLKFYSKGAKVVYSYLSIGEAFEYAVMEYSFSFWQYGYDCDDIPNEAADIQAIATHFLSVSDLTGFSDKDIEKYSSFFYQSATEMGFYGYETNEFQDYLIDLPTDANPMCLFFTFDMTDKFRGQLLNDLNLWLKTNGDRFIYIYGGNDAWSASAVPYNPEVDSEWFVLKGKHHGNARIRSMTLTEQEKLISTLEKWLSIKITPPEK